jgi:chromosomal replication initiation ATPase DnaA
MSTSVETNVWGRILHSLEGRLNQQTLETWFRPIQFERLDNSEHVLHLRAPNQIVKDTVVTNYAAALDESLVEQRLSGYSVGWVIGKVSDWVPQPTTSSPEKTAAATATAVAREIPREDIVDTVVSGSAIASAEPSLSSKYN